ncbi:hypothetical protein [Gordonia sp. SL306]|uniref:hypothetical protein n=1 Tax=Gordonia sp. SL306 TaxID=2995145 RepID=UPI002270A9C2|nr:hypothetical protein [Gordonia sp. SL306]WAC57190.1 hypothetical protein OVA31_08110 [Gordonia sp. SL306]
MRRVIRVFWGRRPEPVESVAARWRQTLEQVAPLLSSVPAVAELRWRQVRASGPPTPVSVGELVSLLIDAQSAEPWSDRVGVGLRVIAGTTAGLELEISGVAGGEPEYLLQSTVLAVESPEGVVIDEVGLLAMLATIWEPDFGDVTDDAILDALEDDAGYTVGEPVVGRVGYLSPGRARLVPHGEAMARIDLPSGGVLLTVADPGDVEAVVDGYRRLDAAGVLRPLATPLERATL